MISCPLILIDEGGISMLQERTLEKVLKILQPMRECGILSEPEFNEIRCLNEKIHQNPQVIPAMKTIQETADIFHTTQKAIFDYINQKKLERIRFTRKKVLITEESIIRFIEECRKESSREVFES